MKRLFAVGVIGVILLEIAQVYFVMPMPGSQRMRSIDAAYFLHRWRWPLRAFFLALVLRATPASWRLPRVGKWLVSAAFVLMGGMAYMANFQMAADHMFLQPTALVMQPAERSNVAPDRLVVGIEVNGDARAYPLQFIGYHHQVRDRVGGQQVLVSFCTVCRTGRVFVPIVDGRTETFRLVGMDHFNAMFEDETTGSWWRQANGEAIVGKRKGQTLFELPSVQVTLKQWLALHSKSLVMQGDPVFAKEYEHDYAYERGTSTKKLTGTDVLSWRDKSWVVGLTVNKRSKAYDWNRLRRERVVNDVLGGVPIVLALGEDDQSFFAFERPDAATRFQLRGDSLVAPGTAFALNGRGSSSALKALNASQEFWHSWREFQPQTERY
jgi:hypothetical protein